MDSILDLPNLIEPSHPPQLVSKVIEVIERTRRYFGETTCVMVNALMQKAMREFAEGFAAERLFLSMSKSGYPPNLPALGRLQIKRNADLFLYFDTYSNLIGAPKRLSKCVRRRLGWFGLVDSTIDDFLDLDSDRTAHDYNVFLVSLSAKLGLDVYMQKTPRNIIRELESNHIFEDILTLIDPTRKNWNLMPPPFRINGYLKRITLERYNLLRTTLMISS